MNKIFLALAFIFLTIQLGAADDNDNLFGFSHQKEEALVVKVVASDYIVLEDGRHVRLIGVESLGPPPPKEVIYDKTGKVIETVQEPTIPIEEQAISYAQEMMENKKVELEYDIDARETSTGSLYAYVFLPDGRMANAQLLRMGFVKLRIVPPNVKYEDRLRDAYMQAKAQKRGLEGY